MKDNLVENINELYENIQSEKAELAGILMNIDEDADEAEYIENALEALDDALDELAELFD